MFTQQRLFEYRDKPGRVLDRCWQTGQGNKLLSICMSYDIKEKLDLFSDYYSSLDSSSGPAYEMRNSFFDKVNIKQIE